MTSLLETIQDEWVEVELLDYLELVKSGVKPFKGTKKYIDTGSLVTGKIIDYENVDFETRPSRANMEVREGDVLFAKMKDTEKVFQISKDDQNNLYSTGFSVLRVKDKSKILSEFIFFWLRSKEFQRMKNKECTGATQKAINERKLKLFKIKPPYLSTQRKIIAVLKLLDQAKKLRREADVLTKDYIKSIYIKKFCSSESKHWKEVSIKDLASKKNASMRTGPFGSDLKHGEFVESGIAVLGIDNAVKNYFDWKERRFITKEKYEKLKRYRIYPRDVIITIMATIGRSAVIPDNIPLAINTKHLAALTLDEKKVNPYFLSYSIHSNPYILNQIKSNNRGSIMAGMNLGIIKELKIKIPPLSLQNDFEKTYHQFSEITEIQAQSKNDLENLFNSSLQKALRGELKC